MNFFYINVDNLNLFAILEYIFASVAKVLVQNAIKKIFTRDKKKKKNFQK